MADFDALPPEDLLPPNGNAGSAPSAGPRLVPHNVEAEEAVLGAILINPEAYYDVAQSLKADDFYIHKNGWIWEAFTRLHDQRAPVDFLTVQEELERHGRLVEAGGAPYLTALINNTPTSLHAAAYARIVEQASVRRKLLGAANDIAKLAYEESTDIDEVMDRAEQSVFGVSERRLTSELRPIQQVVSEYYDRVDYLARHKDELRGVPTGFIDLDLVLGGMQKSDLLIIAGRPGTGKTGFMLSVAKNAAQIHKKRVAFFSLEMSDEQLVQRLVAMETGIDSQRLRLASLNDDEWPLFTHAVGVLSETPVFLDDTAGLSAFELRTRCRRLHAEFGLDLIIVDYLQLMSGDLRSENRVQEVSYLTRSLKNLARELNIPVLAGSQLAREVERRPGNEPKLADLRESGTLEQDADVVMLIYREEMYNRETLNKNVAEINVAKHRNGPTKKISLVFRERLAKFENAATVKLAA